MLTKKQVKDLPKGTFSNAQLAEAFPTHGKSNREVTLPVDQKGDVISNLLAHASAGKPYHMRRMRLNRQISKRYKA